LDAGGHFMRRFRNVLMKLSQEYSELTPEYDRVELSVIEDSYLHLNFLYEAYGSNNIRVVLADTWMMGTAVLPEAAFKMTEIDGNQIEQTYSYKLAKGRHYSLSIFYTGGKRLDENGQQRCSVYDVIFQISHQARIALDSACPPKDDVLSFTSELPKKITDKDLDGHGIYNFHKLLRLTHPKDFTGTEKEYGNLLPKQPTLDVLT